MPFAHVHSITLTGVQGHLVEVEADITNGPPGLLLVGLPDAVVRETTDRVRAAILNSGETWPQRKITVTLSPVSLPKRGTGSDLAIAAAILAASGAVPPDALAGLVLLGELGLDGQVRPVTGILPAVTAAAACGFTAVAVPQAGAAEAALVPGMRVLPVPGLAGLLAHLRGRNGSDLPVAVPGQDRPGPATGAAGVAGQPDLCDVRGRPGARRAAEVCAAGGHHLAMTGPPGAGAAMLAERLPGLLPPLGHAAMEVTAVHSLAGRLPPGQPLITSPPLSAPHHTATKAAIFGGGSGTIRPGAVSLAHRGVLFLQDAPEFSRDVLDALRQPLETGEVAVARSGLRARFPARFLLVVAARPCPCAQPAGCTCTLFAKRCYQSRLSGLLNHVEVKAELRPAAVAGPPGETSAAVAARVALARERAAARLAGTPWRLNSEIPGSELRRRFPPGRDALARVERALQLGQISAATAGRVLRVAWTLADLAAKPRPGPGETGEALSLWLGVTP